ncbi:MAG: carboxypeptidase regulatory-like domain-containing protein [Gemmataceae bacterium]
MKIRWRLALWPLCAAGLLIVLFVPRAIPPRPITGVVRDATGPVAGARVRWQGETVMVLTDADGRFRLPGSRSPAARVTAAKEGYVIAGVPAATRPLVITLERVPDGDCERYAWVDPRPDPEQRHNCGNCHQEIFQQWSASSHARSATGKHFLNLYAGTDWHGTPNRGWSLLAEHPDGAGVCTACHAPTVDFGDPAYFDLRHVRGVAAQGVHCDYCHKIAEADTAKLGIQHGRFGLTLKRPEHGQLFFGPLDDVDRGEDAFSPLYHESRYCASCHEGTVFGVPVYTTYSEWLDSPAGRAGVQCQDCHMTPTGQMTNIAPGRGGLERHPLTLSNHRFVVGSREEMLRRCLHITMTATRSGAAVRAAARVRADGVGHRVPTGFIDRNLALVIEGLTMDNQSVLAIAGPRLPAAAGLEPPGLAGKLYAKRTTDFDGHSPAPFWRPPRDLVDTRLVPGQTDEIVVHFPTTIHQVRVRLFYRRFWPEVAHTKDWPDNEKLILEKMIVVHP